MCERDQDCGSNPLRECYYNVSWSPDKNYCDCSNWYGLEGDDCTELGPGGKWTVAITVVWLVVAFLMLVSAIHDGVKAYYLKVDILKDHRNTFITWILIQIEAILTVIFSANRFLHIYVDQDVHYQPMLNKPRKYSTSSLLNIYILALMMCFGFVCALNVAISWMEIVRSLQKRENISSAIIRHSIIVVRILQISVAVLLICMSVFTSVPILDIILAVGVLVLLVYLVGLVLYLSASNEIYYFHEMEMIFKFGKVDETFSTNVQMVKTHAAVVIASIIGFIVCTSIWINLNKEDYKETCRKGEICSFLVVSDLLFSFGLSIVASISVYYHFVLVRTQKKYIGSRRSEYHPSNQSATTSVPSNSALAADNSVYKHISF